MHCPIWRVSLDPFTSRVCVGEWRGGLASKNGRVGKCVDLRLSFCWDPLWDCVRNASEHQLALARVPKAGFALHRRGPDSAILFISVLQLHATPCQQRLDLVVQN